MRILPNPRLFWFLKSGISLDTEDPASLDLYVQQVLSRGTASDVRELLKQIDPASFGHSFERIRNFLPPEIKSFWEHFLADYQPHSRYSS